MNTDLNLGPVNGHAVGRILKEAVRRATVAIRSERMVFEAHVKESHGGSMDDVFTSADRKAQEIYLRTLQECFPCCGVVAEEDALSIAPRDGCTAYFTVDPLDGTKAFVRRQSHGVGTMIGLVDNGQVLSAYVGDINTEEVYGYRPGSNRVHRITRLDTFEELTFCSPWEPDLSYALLRDPMEDHSPLAQALIGRHFKSYLVDGGSIGIWLARLWKREVSAALLRPVWETPWDSIPVIGICRKLGYVFLRPDPAGERWMRFDPPLAKEKYWRDRDMLVMHEDDVARLGLSG